MKTKFTIEDFKEVTPEGSGFNHLSLKVKGFEICVEPLLFKHAYVALYDKKKNLIGEKAYVENLFVSTTEEQVEKIDTLMEKLINSRLKYINKEYTFSNSKYGI